MKTDLPYRVEKDPDLRAWNVLGPDDEVLWTAPGKGGDAEASYIASKLNEAFALGQRAARP